MTAEEKAEDDAPKIFVDEDWKQKAEAEKQAMEEEAPDAADSGKTEASSEEGPGEADYDLPPASFPSLLQEFSTRALVSLGMIQNPFSGESQVDLRAAAYSIDMLAILQEKTEGNLEEAEGVYLGQLIAQLREAFLKVSAAAGSAPDGESPGEGGEATEEAAPPAEAPAEEAPAEEAPAEEAGEESEA